MSPDETPVPPASTTGAAPETLTVEVGGERFAMHPSGAWWMLNSEGRFFTPASANWNPGFIHVLNLLASRDAELARLRAERDELSAEVERKEARRLALWDELEATNAVAEKRRLAIRDLEIDLQEARAALAEKDADRERGEPEGAREPSEEERLLALKFGNAGWVERSSEADFLGSLATHFRLKAEHNARTRDTLPEDHEEHGWLDDLAESQARVSRRLSTLAARLTPDAAAVRSPEEDRTDG